MIKAIKAWWRYFRRDCVRTSLIRHYGFPSSKITEQTIDDTLWLSEQVKTRTLKMLTALEAYLYYPDSELIIKAHDWLKDQGCDNNLSMIIWAIRNGKVNAE